MILIGEVLISQDIVDEQFACNLKACKGACCVEGDFGAPLTPNEVIVLENLLSDVFPYISKASQDKISTKGFAVYNEQIKGHETGLMEDGACVFMGRDEIGITYCGIEKAYYDGKIDFKKPISCHLYPIRVSKNEQTGFEALNYDRWDICKSACQHGKKESIQVFEFAKEALTRAYGKDFYEELSSAAEHLKKNP